MQASAPLTPYDTIRYPGLPYPDTHPDRLASVATFYGMDPAPPEKCTVLEIGCGDGGNLVPMAYGLPGSVFTGIDLAGEAIQSARSLAARVGLSNITFEALDLTRFPADTGEFDYIIAHGVYSWIPPNVRDALISLIGRHLAPKGVAFVSYNTLPGCHVRRMVWDMLKFHTGELEDPGARLSEAAALLRLVAHGNVQPDQYTQPLVAEAQRMEERIPALLFHDDLSPVNDPVYFHEFTDHAARHGLQFLAEASLVTSSYAGVAPEARGVLAALDPITRQQYLDFIKCRRFRETLLCRDEVTLQRDGSPSRMKLLTFTAARRVQPVPRDGDSTDAARDPSGNGDTRDEDVALVRVALDVLRDASPRALPMSTLVERISARPDVDRMLAARNTDLDAVLLAALQASVIEPHVVAPRLVSAPGARPTASAVVRAQLTDGDIVASLWHQPVKVDDEIAQRLLPLLDGSRDRSELLAAMIDRTGPGAPGAAALETHLVRLARLGLLTA